jgi:cytochrome d ubiquinol oxidase subunit II
MTLEILWFCLICFFWTGYFILEGFDFGVGILLPVLGRTEQDRRTMFTSIGPVWDANEVWLIVAGGATFAAFPLWYSTMFSGFYLALVLVLVLLIVRVLTFEWRSKAENPRWRAVWTQTNTVGSIGAPLVWGIALANLLQGVPVNADQTYAGNFGDLFSLYTVTAGIAVVVLFAFHGAVFLTLRTEGALRERARHVATRLGPVAVIVGAGFLVWTLAVAADRNDRSLFPGVVIVAVAAFAVVTAVWAVRARRERLAFAATAATVGLTVVTLFVSLYPRVLVSSPAFENSLTISNTASAHYTLTVMTIVAAVVTPVVLLYQGWTYHVFRARVGGTEPAGSPVDLIARKTGSPPAGTPPAGTPPAGTPPAGTPPAGSAAGDGDGGGV